MAFGLYLYFWFFILSGCQRQPAMQAVGPARGRSCSSFPLLMMKLQGSKHLAIRRAAVPFVTGMQPISLHCGQTKLGLVVVDIMKVLLPLHPHSSTPGCCGRAENAVGSPTTPVFSFRFSFDTPSEPIGSISRQKQIATRNMSSEKLWVRIESYKTMKISKAIVTNNKDNVIQLSYFLWELLNYDFCEQSSTS